MKISLTLRLFLVHLLYTLAFTAVAGFVTVRVVQKSYVDYVRKVQEQVSTIKMEKEFMPMMEEVALSLLRATSGDIPEANEKQRREISAGLNVVLRGLPAVQGFLLLDSDNRIQYASETRPLDLLLIREEDRKFLANPVQSRRQVSLPGGAKGNQTMVPIREGEKRIGSLLLTLIPDRDLLARRPSLESPVIQMKNITIPVLIFLVLIGFGSLVVAAVSSQSVRRLDRALDEYRKRGFEGGLQAEKLAKKGELAGAVRAISEMGGKLEKLTREGKEREALLGTLSASLEDAMIALGPDGSPIAWNQAACRLLGEESQAGEEETIRRILECNPWWVEGRGGEDRPVQQEDEVKLPGGVSVPAKLTRVPIEIRPGETGELLLIRDLAMLRKVESHLLEAGRYAVLAHLAAGMAHEIRNPLHSIGLNAEVVEEYLEIGSTEAGRQAIRESLTSIQEETRRLTDLLNNYLGLARPSAGADSVNLRELCRRVIRLLAYTARQADVELVLTGTETLPLVEGNAERLQQAILNLVLNALQAMPSGGRIILETGKGDGGVILQVSDTGPGVPGEMKGRLFDVSVTSKSEGAGLGLPLVRLIAEAHGGSITYNSGENGGACFTLVLPAGSARPPAGASPFTGAAPS